MTVIIFAILAAGIFLLDLLIKNYIETHLEVGQEKSVCRGKLLIRRYHNRGAFLDAGEKRQKAVALLSLLLTLYDSCVSLHFQPSWKLYPKGRVSASAWRRIQQYL